MPPHFTLYLVFSHGIEPDGGWNDFVGSHQDLKAAIQLGEETGKSWHVVDFVIGKIVCDSSGPYWHPEEAPQASS